MSIEVSDRGKDVRIKVPKEIAEDSSVTIEECKKKERDEDCNWCNGKYACKLFRESLPILTPTLLN